MRPEHWVYTLPLRVRSLFGGARADRDLDDELRDHLDRTTDAYVTQGMTPEDARRRARLDLGGIEQTKERCRDERRVTWTQDIARDLRYGVRMLRKAPAFTAVAIVTLALGIGVNTTIFAFANALLFRPPGGVTSVDRLVSVWNRLPNGNDTQFSYPEYTYFRDHNDVFSGLLAYSSDPIQVSWMQPAQTGVANAQLVSANYFSVLGVTPMRGRTFLAGEDVSAGAGSVVVLSNRFWHARLNADPSIIGRTVVLNGHAFTVIGVAPDDFTGLQAALAPDLWTPITMQPVIVPGENRLENRNGYWVFVTGRLKPGVSRRQTQGQMSVLARQVAQANPGTQDGWDASVFGDVGLAPEFRFYALGFGALLMLIVGLVLLIACANVANLVLSRGLARSKEMAVRTALGASRGRLVRQLLLEAVLLSVTAGVVGISLMFVVGPLIMTLVPPMQELSVVHLDLAADWRVIGFTMAIALAAGLGFGWLPAFKTSRVDVLSKLKEDVRSGFRKTRVRNLLVVTQVAVSLTLLAGASLCLKSLSNAQSMNPGFSPHNRVIVSLNPQLVGYSETRGRTFYRTLLDRIANTRGVQSASLVSWLPLGFSDLRAPAYVEGAQYSSTARPFVGYTRVAPGYFAAMGIPLLRGRDFATTDDNTASGVVIVNEEFARRYWPGENPLGKHITVDPNTHDSLEVVGVVQTGKYRTLSERPQPFMYWPLLRYYSGRATLVLQTTGGDAATLAMIKQEIQHIDPNVPIVDAEALDAYMAVPLFSARLTASLLGMFGVLALALAAAGLYSAVAYSVSQRAHEIGIRVALGARRWDVLWQIIREGGRLALIGVVIGSAGAVMLGRLLASLLYGVSAADPLVLTSVALVWFVIALVASYMPARRALNVDPIVTLRYE